MPIRGTICSYLFVAFRQSMVPDISEVVPQLPLHHIQEVFGLRSDLRF
ncbi:hypothetical protein CK203_060270 [Vitis vinifera]|uniref:Uncharacterized protein n=1 Tax=Vitis vinifera TaxID=29760 RepID=A0A438GLT4_VITVI|nr:hypothetical protein CK203_060270 [Vitis vinifera]